MNEEINGIREVLEEIEVALDDVRGVVSHQKRIAFLLSLGSVSLIEEYLRRNHLLKSGGKIDHRWLKKKKENVKKLIAKQTISNLNDLSEFDSILDKASKIEEERNELAYGKPASDERIRELINLFLELKKEVER